MRYDTVISSETDNRLLIIKNKGLTLWQIKLINEKQNTLPYV